METITNWCNVIEAKPLKFTLPCQTSQELRMLSSVTINCQVTKIVINPGSQLSDIVISVANVTTSQYHNNHNIAISQVPIIAPLGCSLMEVDIKVGR